MDVDKSRTSLIKPGDDLPPDSDDEDECDGSMAKKGQALTERNPNIGSIVPQLETDNGKRSLNSVILSLPVTNKGFTCCIQEYGINVPAKSPTMADAGGGMRWKRMFGLFGTTIAEFGEV